MKRYLIILLVAFALVGCGNHHNPGDEGGANIEPVAEDQNLMPDIVDETNTHGPNASAVPTVVQATKPAKIKVYVENSGSMKGYVNGTTDFVDAITDMVANPAFVQESIPVECFYMCGTNPDVHFWGDSFGQKLSSQGMQVQGMHTGTSDLNIMFQKVLNDANNGVISILISDGIYDIGTGDMSSLVIKGRETRTAFLRRLTSGSNLQTLLVKMKSNFNGRYCYTTKNGSLPVNHYRPYYMWIMGDSDLVNQYFSDSYLAGLAGYQNHVRYVRVGNNQLPFVISPTNCIGDIKISHTNPHQLERHYPRNGNLQLALLVDYSDIIYADSYLIDVNNYNCDGANFCLNSIRKASQTECNMVGANYTRPFLILVKTDSPNPRGKLSVELKNNTPGWISNSNASNENYIDDSTTYGFSILTKGIREAYENVSDSIPAKFEITLK